MDALEVSCFGGFQLRSGDHAVPPMPSRAARSLFAYLAVDRGVAHPRERLAARFWPDLPESRARRRLSHTLWQVQDALGEIGDASTWLEVTPDTLAVSADAPCEVDVERFEAGLDRARSRHQHGEDRVRDLSELGAIVELYRGEFLAGHTEPWVLDEQERLHLRYVEALGLLVGMAKRHGSYADALVYARRLTNEDPLREDAHREVMRLSVLQGRVEDALRQFERCREVLADELGTEPSAATQALRDRIARRRERIEPAPAPTTSTAERTPLLGRERERDRGVTLLERTLAGHGGVLFVEAEPGGGTSRLLAELADDADWRGVAVARTELVPAGHLSAFGAVRELAAQLLTPLRLEQLRPRLAPVWLHELAPMVPTLARLQAEPPSPAAGLQAAERAQRLQDAFTHVLLANADLQPLVLVIDGIQWADAESLDVLTALAGQLDGHGVLLAIGYRAEEARADDDVWTALRAIDQRAHPERLRLAPLDAFTVGELVRTLVRGQAVAPEAVTRLHRETGGNPLFLVETVRALAEDDALSWLDPRDDTPLPLPSTIRELVEARLARLAPAERAVLDLAAIADGEVEVGVLAVASELPDEQVMDAAELLVRRQLLVQSSTAIGVRHEQVRRAVVDALDGARAEVIHGRLARALEERGSDQPERLARHFIAAGLVGRAREYLVRAARAAVATHAYATAERAYRQAIQTSAGPQRLDDRIGLLLEHEAVLDVLGEREWQGRVLEELIGLSGSDPRRRSDVLRRRALWHGHRGALDRALEDADRAVGSAEQHLTATTAGAGADHASDAEILARALVARASVLTWASRPTDAVEELERVGRVAPGSAEAIQAQVQLGSVLRELQRYEESRATLESVLAVTVARGNAREETIALGVLGTVEMETGHSDAAIQLYGRAIERAAAIGYRRPQAIHLLNRGVALVTRGHYGPALADLGEAGVVFDAAQDLRGSAVVAVNRAYLRHIVVGDDELARTELEPALHYLRAHDDVAFAATALDTLAGIALRAGELARARDLLEEAVGLVAEPAAGRVRPQVLRRRAELELQAGTPETALDTARQATATATELGMRDEVPAGRVLEAAARLAVDDAPGARTIAMAAVDGLGPGIERAYLVRLVAAEVLEACGDRQEARAMAEQAREEVATALATLEPEEAARGAQLPELVRLDDLVRRLAPVRRLVTVAHRDAPPGRPLAAHERLEVVVELPEETDADPVAARRATLLAVVRSIEAADGVPTVGDLAGVLDVSEATVRRDLAALREDGRRVRTRGHRAR